MRENDPLLAKWEAREGKPHIWDPLEATIGFHGRPSGCLPWTGKNSPDSKRLLFAPCHGRGAVKAKETSKPDDEAVERARKASPRAHWVTRSTHFGAFSRFGGPLEVAKRFVLNCCLLLGSPSFFAEGRLSLQAARDASKHESKGLSMRWSRS